MGPLEVTAGEGRRVLISSRAGAGRRLLQVVVDQKIDLTSDDEVTSTVHYS